MRLSQHLGGHVADGVGARGFSLGGLRFFMVAENECRTKLANKGQVSLPFPPDVSNAQRMPVVRWMPIVILAVLAPTRQCGHSRPGTSHRLRVAGRQLSQIKITSPLVGRAYAASVKTALESICKVALCGTPGGN